MVEHEQQISLNKLRLICGSAYGYDRLARKYRRALGNSPYIAGKAEITEHLEKLLIKAASAAQVLDIILGEVKVLYIVDDLFKTGGNGKSAAVRYLAEEDIKVCDTVSHAFDKIAVSHSQLVEIAEHGIILGIIIEL